MCIATLWPISLALRLFLINKKSTLKERFIPGAGSTRLSLTIPPKTANRIVIVFSIIEGIFCHWNYCKVDQPFLTIFEPVFIQNETTKLKFLIIGTQLRSKLGSAVGNNSCTQTIL